jgi:hypothetical protein
MLWNRKANVLNNYIVSKGIEKKVIIDELPNNSYKFYFNRKLKELDCGVFIFINETELNQVVIGISHYEICENLSPLYEKLNQINMESNIAYFFADGGDIYASFPFLSTESEFNPILLLNAIETVFRFMDETVYKYINSAIIDCIKLNDKEKKEQDYKELTQDSSYNYKEQDEYYENSNYSSRAEYNSIAEKYGYDDDAIESSPEYWDMMYNKTDDD